MTPSLVNMEAFSILEHSICLIIVPQAGLVHCNEFVTCCISTFVAIYDSVYHGECQHFET
jgi:hypothetical protein